MSLMCMVPRKDSNIMITCLILALSSVSVLCPQLVGAMLYQHFPGEIEENHETFHSTG